jgi:predicted kinase
MAQPLFIVFAGLPGTGKSSVARALAAELSAVWLRVDSLEQAIRAADIAGDDLKDAGYRAAYALASDNLKLGRTVVGDSVNPWMLTRNAWRDVGLGAGARMVEVETICSDAVEHRRRVETRVVDVPGLALPDWQAVITRDYHAWDREHLIVDTAGRSVAECVGEILKALQK